MPPVPANTNPSSELASVLREIRAGRICPCYLVHGEEDYLVERAVEAIVDAIIPPTHRAFNLVVMEGGEVTLGRLYEALVTFPLVEGPKVVLVRDARFFQPSRPAADQIARIRALLESDPEEAARAFLALITRWGWQLADFVEDDGWKRVEDDRWQALGNDRAWVERVVSICREQGIGAPPGEDGEEELARMLASGLPAGHSLVMTARTVDRRMKLYRVVADVGKVISCAAAVNTRQKQARVMKMAQGILAAAEKTMTSEAWERLGARTGFELRESLAELEKLIVHTGARAQITAADVDALVGKTKGESVFRLTGALARKDGVSSLLVLAELFAQDTPPPMIVALLARELGLLMRARIGLEAVDKWRADMDLASFQRHVFPRLREMSRELARLNPFIAYQVAKNASGFAREELTQALTVLSQVDRAIKTTGRDPRLLLERFILAVTA